VPHQEEGGGQEVMARDFCLECSVLVKARCRVCWGAAWYMACHVEVFSEEEFLHA